MLLDFIIISFVVGLVRGGRVKEYPKFDGLWMLIISICLQILSSLVPFITFKQTAVSLGYLFALLFLFNNRKYEDIRIFMTGWSLNAICIWSNLGRMPIGLDAAKKTPYPIEGLINNSDWKHTLITPSTHLPFLGDIFYLPYPIPRVISIGDIFITLGAFLLVQRIMNKPISLIGLRVGKKYDTKG
jgi:hypothetical protein